MNNVINFIISSWNRLKYQRTARFGFATLFILFACALVMPLVSHYSYRDLHFSSTNQPPSLEFWFGTDDLGRDLFTRVWWGARISLFVAITASFFDLVIGVLYGALSAYIGGKVDQVLMRIADVLYAVPHLLIALLLMVVLGPGLMSIVVALTFTGWINMARMVRGQILQLKQQDFVKGAICIGASPARILCLHLLPNAAGPIIATLALTIPNAIFSEAFLSFLGLGIQAPIASLGTLASEGAASLLYHPYKLFFPALLISLMILAFNLIGDALRDAFDPKGAK